MNVRILLVVACVAIAVFVHAESAPLPVAFKLDKGDHVAIVGNTLAERMQHHGWMETLLHSRLAGHELTFRNLGFSGDELTHRLRSAGFGTPDEHLAAVKADVVFAMFGYNESFAGAAGLAKFKDDLEKFVRHTLAQKYNGKSSPRLVLFSPIAHEDLGDKNLPDGAANNANLQLYTTAIAEMAAKTGVTLVDLFTVSRDFYATSQPPLTINGIHLNEHGDRMLAGAIERALFPNGPLFKRDAAQLEKIRQAVLDKNFHWFQRYRTVDGYSIYGGRADLSFVDGQTNRIVMKREMEVLDAMTANRDRHVWALAQGRDEPVSDANLPPFLPVKTNAPGRGPGGSHLFLGGEESITKMSTANDIKVNLFASEEMFPELANPVQMTFDAKGRMWVAVMPSYPHWKPTEKMNDMVLILEDTNGDGRADKRTVFADKLHVPTGLELWNGGLLVGQQPDLLFLKDTNGDDVADTRERVLHGLDSADTHHAINSFVLDPGGALYLQEGTFHHTQVESPYGPPRRCANAGVFRYDPRRQKFDVYVSYGFANPHGHVFDRWGQDFVTDGTGNDNYYALPFSGSVDFPRKHPGMQTFYKQRMRPCPGTEIISSRHFPESWQGYYLDANVIGFQGILMYKILDQGSGFTAQEVEPLIYSSDASFRPTDMEIGPDGALYFLDWQNPIIGHMQHNLRDPSRDRTHGRVYRLTHEQRPLLKPAAVAGEPIEKLLELLKEPEDRLRYRVRIELSGRDSDQVVAAVGKWIDTLDASDPEHQHHLMEALWVHQHHNRVNEALLQRMLRSSDYRARAAATRVLRAWSDQLSNPLALFERQVEDEHPRVRLEAVVALSDIREARAAEIALKSLNHSTDYYLDYALNETMTTLESLWKPLVSAGEPFAAGNPAGANYILRGVSTPDLIKMTRTAPVCLALLSRPAVIPQHRQEALAELARINRSDEMAELVQTLARLDESSDGGTESALYDLAPLLAARKSFELAMVREKIAKLATGARRPVTRQVGYVAMLLADGSIDRTWSDAAKSAQALRDLIDSAPLVPDTKLRQALYPKIAPLVTSIPEPLASQIKTARGTSGRYVRINLPGGGRTLTLAEVQVESRGENIAPRGTASQASTSHGGEAKRAIDGKTTGEYNSGTQTHSREGELNPWWEVDLGAEYPIDAVVVWNRTDGGHGKRLDGFTLTVLDGSRKVVATKPGNAAPPQFVRIELESDQAAALQRSAMMAVASIPGHEAEAFSMLARLAREGTARAAAVSALRRIPKALWPRSEVRPLVDSILSYVEKLPETERTAPAVRDALQLGGELAGLLPGDQAKKIRAVLGDLGVPMLIVRPVPHRMVFDRTNLYVQVGKQIEVVLDNIDIMPHNMLVVAPGATKEIGEVAERMATDPDAFTRHFVPRSPKVLFATKMVQPRQSERLLITAPNTSGEYPYICTFPGHWRTMFGTLHVVSSADQIPPEATVTEVEPLVQPRPFVRDWKHDDLVSELDQAAKGRSFERGRELFTAIACAACHKVRDKGGQIGPDLTDVTKRFKRAEVWREMIDPSQVINEKYRTQIIETGDGELVTGVIVAQDEKSIRVMANPLEKCEPKEVRLDNIESRQEAKVSLMPTGLLTTLSKDEILDLLAYVESGGDASAPAFKK